MTNRLDRFDGCYNCQSQEGGYCPEEHIAIKHDKMACHGAKWKLKHRGENIGETAST